MQKINNIIKEVLAIGLVIFVVIFICDYISFSNKKFKSKINHIDTQIIGNDTIRMYLYEYKGKEYLFTK